jgi:hypothetical protein
MKNEISREILPVDWREGSTTVPREMMYIWLLGVLTEVAYGHDRGGKNRFCREAEGIGLNVDSPEYYHEYIKRLEIARTAGWEAWPPLPLEIGERSVLWKGHRPGRWMKLEWTEVEATVSWSSGEAKASTFFLASGLYALTADKEEYRQVCRRLMAAAVADQERYWAEEDRAEA